MAIRREAEISVSQRIFVLIGFYAGAQEAAIAERDEENDEKEREAQRGGIAIVPEAEGMEVEMQGRNMSPETAGM
jgi:hypothetical protein